MLPTFVDHVEKLVQSSLSTNTTNAFEKAVQAFQLFRAQFSLQHTWPRTVDQLMNFLAYLFARNLSFSTAKSYLAGLGFFLQLYGYQNTVEAFIVQKMLTGFRRQNPTQDIRSPITYSMLSKILSALPNLTKSLY